MLVGGVAGLTAFAGLAILLVSPRNASAARAPTDGAISGSRRVEGTRPVDPNTARSRMIRRLTTKRIPLEEANEIAYAIYPDPDSAYPRQPAVRDRKAAAELVFSFGFARSQLEQLSQLLWDMSVY